jgi:hypothetical protein
MIYLLTAIFCHPVAAHIYTQTIHRTTQITTVFTSYILVFALQLRKTQESGIVMM